MKPNLHRTFGVRLPVSMVLNGGSPMLADAPNPCGPSCDARLARMRPHLPSEKSSLLMLPARASGGMRHALR